MDNAPASNSPLWLAFLALTCFFVLGPSPLLSQEAGPGDPTKSSKAPGIVGPEQCAECHEFELKTLQQSSHQNSFLLHRKDAASKIAKAMGGEARVDKREDCARCHYTKKARASGSPEILAGVSCESCHGPAKRWWNVHWKGEGKKLKKNMAKSEKRGMIRPRNLVGLIDRCLDCHLIDDESLVSKGGHPEAEGFEFVSWLQGEVRHNFLNSEEYGGNVPVSKIRQRCFFILGRLRQLERVLLVFASLKDREGALAKSLGRDILRAYKDLKRARGTVKSLSKVRDQLAKIKLKDSPTSEIKQAAKGIASLFKELSEDPKAMESKALDALLPTKYRGKVSEFKDSE